MTDGAYIGGMADADCEVHVPDNPSISIVIIDDDPLQLRLAEKHFTHAEAVSRPKRVLTFNDPAEALAHLPVDGITAILCDYDMPTVRA